MTRGNASAEYWDKGLTPTWGVTKSLDLLVRRMLTIDQDLVPNLHLGNTIVVISDYGGQHKGCTHESFSFLIVNQEFLWKWEEERQIVRNRFLSDGRRMSYKTLNDKWRLKALIPLLQAANWLPGLLISVSVEKRFTKKDRLPADHRIRLPRFLASWPEHVVSRMFYASHFGSLFIAGLSREMQNVLWLTDEDDFVANDDRVVCMTPIFCSTLSSYSSRQMGRFRFGTTRCDPGDLSIEDLASIPDLVCGALGDIASAGLLSSRVDVPLMGNIPSKALAISSWLSEMRTPLRKLSFLVEIGDTPGLFRTKCLRLSEMK